MSIFDRFFGRDVIDHEENEQGVFVPVQPTNNSRNHFPPRGQGSAQDIIMQRDIPGDLDPRIDLRNLSPADQALQEWCDAAASNG